MNKYCVLRLFAEFKIIYMDREAAELWRNGGWELRSYASLEEAQRAMEKWEVDLRPAA